jgi:MoaA/NifB/PqqE/SkfB family radical SAM enzyme
METIKKDQPIFFDPAILRKTSIINETLKTDFVPLPSVVEISESGTCNRSCSFCPRSDPAYPNEKKFISKNLIVKLSNELSEFNYNGIVLFSGFVEPLLDKKIFDHIGILRKKLPNARIELVTNGDPLNAFRLKKLFDSGLSTILISVYDGKDQADYFQALCEEINLTQHQFVIRHRYLPEEQHFGITLNNRAGMMKNAQYSIPETSHALTKPCYYPHYTFFMDYVGDVLLCPHDWGKKRIAGNLLKKSFFEIWTGKVFNHARKKLGNGDRNFLPCAVCDVNGILMGKGHKDAWDRIQSS